VGRKPCPFCGKTNICVGTKDGYFALKCESCGMSGPFFKTLNEANLAWDIRTGEYEHIFQIQKLECLRDQMAGLLGRWLRKPKFFDALRKDTEKLINQALKGGE